ncbi:MAG TPA: DUF6036 family nucleotidyltransferase [Candidatus Acidoferrales bacterium]|nr:DUF6036 family nucleotidyltransferase [Candidatus Acidoferrales bacterium]
MSPELFSPWKEFLEEIDALLDEPFQVHCIGGFALVVGYGLPRATNDLDYRTLVPYSRMKDLQSMAGPGSALAKKYKVQVQHTGVDSIPENYEERLIELFAGHFKNIHLFVPDPYDLALSKLTRNLERDRQDVEFLARTQHLDPAILRERYEKELRPIVIGPESRHDATLEFWLRAYFQNPDSWPL